jgi:hypothetical protein
MLLDLFEQLSIQKKTPFSLFSFFVHFRKKKFGKRFRILDAKIYRAESKTSGS